MIISYVLPSGATTEVETDSPIPPHNAMVVINGNILGRVEDVTYYYHDDKETRVSVFLWKGK